MAALIFVIGSLLEQLHRVAGVYINSGFSIRECREFIRETRRQLLFERYLEELKSLPDPSDNIVNNCDCPARDSKTMGDYEDIEIIEGVEISEVSPDNCCVVGAEAKSALARFHVVSSKPVE